MPVFCLVRCWTVLGDGSYRMRRPFCVSRTGVAANGFGLGQEIFRESSIFFPSGWGGGRLHRSFCISRVAGAAGGKKLFQKWHISSIRQL